MITFYSGSSLHFLFLRHFLRLMLTSTLQDGKWSNNVPGRLFAGWWGARTVSKEYYIIIDSETFCEYYRCIWVVILKCIPLCTFISGDTYCSYIWQTLGFWFHYRQIFQFEIFDGHVHNIENVFEAHAADNSIIRHQNVNVKRHIFPR